MQYSWYSFLQILTFRDIHSPATLLATPVNCLVTLIANQPITWQQLNAFRHLDVVKTSFWSSNRASEGEERGFKWLWTWNGCWCRRAGLSISQTRVYREWSEKEKLSRERQLCGWKCLVEVRGQRRMNRLVRDDRKTTVTQITTRYNQAVVEQVLKKLK